MKTSPSFAYEDKYDGIICGMDEVGRGCLAGVVVAAAVIIDRDRMPVNIIEQLNDSKKLSAQKRAYLFNKIQEFSCVSVAECSVADIDKINILQASLKAMEKTYKSLKIKPNIALIDGNKSPKLPCFTETIIKGDSKSYSIAAASIIAKHFRDTLMKKMSKDYPPYGWETNAGYGTAHHLKALEIHGVTPHHRRTFSPVANLLHKDSITNI